MLYLDEGILYADECRLDPTTMTWSRAALPATAAPTGEVAAVAWLQRGSGTPFRGPVAVLGPRDASEEEYGFARALGRRLGRLGLVVLCGGRQGVMEAVCRGAKEGGGISVGLLPDDDWRKGNAYVTVPVATGIGIARNALIARAAACAVAVGGGLGTLSEIALGLQFQKRVFGACNAPHVKGLRVCGDLDRLESEICLAILQLPSRLDPEP